MKQVIILVSILSVSIGLYSQSTIPSLVKMNSLTKSSLATFDKYARSIGFAFLDKSIDDEKSIYTYTRDVKVNDITYSEVFVLRIWNDPKRMNILFKTVRVDLNSYYQNQLTANKYSSIDCNIPDDDDSGISFCYETSQFGCRLIDERIKTGLGMSNQYSIVVYKRL